LKRYIRALEGLQTPEEQAVTQKAVTDFLKGEGKRLQSKLLDYAKDKASYIEEFWYESYLSHSDPVVLALNPFFVLEDDPVTSRGDQLHRAASLVGSSLGFIHDLRAGVLEPDNVRGIPLDMDQYTRLFGTSRIPTEVRSSHAAVTCSDDPSRKDVIWHPTNTLGTSSSSDAANSVRSSHILSRSLTRSTDYFDVFDSQNRPLLTEAAILANLKAIVSDADRTPIREVAKGAIGLLSTENRKTWSQLRKMIQKDPNNKKNLKVVDDALFVVCLDDAGPQDVGQVCANFLCGTYDLEAGLRFVRHCLVVVNPLFQVYKLERARTGGMTRLEACFAAMQLC
jgi:carnitine O-acetyltransferase